ncbi:MAG: hypothetical protein IH855_10600 [Bacteroidetes bacterium]|nr:hypothetical protein [Bacteroidota bacterium]
MFILGSVVTNVILAVSLILAAAVAGLMAYHYAKARLREHQGYIYDPETETVEPDRAGMEQRAKNAEEISQIRTRIEALMEHQQMAAETQKQHLGQKLDEIRTHMGQQDAKMDGIKSELRHEIRRSDSELGELRGQLAKALDAFWKSMPALSEGNGSDDARALPPAQAAPEADHTTTEPDYTLGEKPNQEHAGPDLPQPIPTSEPAEATFAPIEAEPAPIVPIGPEPESDDSMPEPAEATFAPIASAPEPVVEKPEEIEAKTAGIDASEPAPESAASAPDVPQEEPVGDDTPAKAFVFEPVVLETPVQPAAPLESPMTDMPNAPDVAPPATEEAIWTNAAEWTDPAQANAQAAPSEPASPPAQPPADPPAAQDPAPTAPVIEQMVISPSGDSISVEPLAAVQTEPTDAAPTSDAILDAASPHTGEPTIEAPQPSPPVQPPTSRQPAQEPVSQPGPEPAQPDAPTSEDRPTAASENGTASPDLPRDDLTVISSISEETQQQLYDIGITKLDEMARWSRADARRVGGQVNVSEETIMHQWIFEAQSVLFDSFQDKMASKQATKQAQ